MVYVRVCICLKEQIIYLHTSFTNRSYVERSPLATGAVAGSDTTDTDSNTGRLGLFISITSFILCELSYTQNETLLR